MSRALFGHFILLSSTKIEMNNKLDVIYRESRSHVTYLWFYGNVLGPVEGKKFELDC